MEHYWESNELTECWSLNFEELALLKSKPPKNHLPFCFQLKFYQHFGRFPQSYDEIAEASLKYLKEQLDEFEIEEYDWKGRTAKRHRAEILKYLDIRKSTTKEREQFCEWLISDLIPKLSNVKELVSRSEVWFLRHKLELPTEFMLERLIRSAITTHEERTFLTITQALCPNSIQQIDTFLSECIETRGMNNSKR